MPADVTTLRARAVVLPFFNIYTVVGLLVWGLPVDSGEA
jgi:hypothetical protein